MSCLAKRICSLFCALGGAFPLAVLGLASTAPAQGCIPGTVVYKIAQTGIGSNGFGTSWRGQDVVLTEDAWVTRIQFSTGSATTNVDEIRLMTATPQPKTLVATKVVIKTNVVEGILPKPFYCRAKQRYTVWFHQTGSPRGTNGCDLSKVDPTWVAYHTNVDPTLAPSANDPGYWWGYKYGTNMQLIGGDNFETSGNWTPGGNVQLDVLVCANDFGALFLSLGTMDLTLPTIDGVLRVDPSKLLGIGLTFRANTTGNWRVILPIPNNPILRGLDIYGQVLHDATFLGRATLTVMDSFSIR